MDYNIDKQRQKRLKTTGKWFESQSKRSNVDIYLTIIMPLILIISLCATIYVALT